MGGPAQLFHADRLSFQVTHHELFVALDDLLDDHLIGLGRRQRTLGRVFIVLFEYVDHAGERGPVANWYVERDALRAEVLTNRLQVRAVVHILRVHLGDGDEPPQPEPPRLLEQPARVDLDSGGS